MNTFRSKRTAMLASVVASALVASASGVVGRQPGAGSFYLYNEARGQYLAVGSDGRLLLSDVGQELTLTPSDEATGSYTLAAAQGTLYTTFQGGVLAGSVPGGAAGQYSQWMFKPVGGKTGIYTLSCRDNTATASAYIYYSTLAAGIGRTYTEPQAAGEWKLVASDDRQRIVTIDETATAYARPSQQTSMATVHLRRTFTLGSWNTLCLPFAVSGEQLKEQLGDDVQLVAFDKYENNTIVCIPVDGLNVKAGTPYLVLPTKAPADGHDYYEFADVASFADAPTTLSHNGVSFKATFASTIVPAGITGIRRNLVYTTSKAMPMKGTRAYFVQTEQSAATAPIMLWSIGDTPTSIDKVLGEGHPVDIYTIGGVLVRSQATSADGLARGVYVVEGRKFVKH